MQRTFDIEPFLRNALAEDIGAGDVTGNAVIPAAAQATFAMNAREELVVCGLRFIPALFALIDPSVTVTLLVEEGAQVKSGTMLATLQGPARALLAGERTALNLLQHLCGVATLTRRYVEEVAGTQAKITDTRKTLPGWRYLQKYAVRCGGGHNHRMGLYDAVLIKDNHLAIAGSVAAAVKAARAYSLPYRGRVGEGSYEASSVQNNGPHLTSPLQGEELKIEVECDTLTQLDEALAAGVDIVLLDNMDHETLREGVARAHAKNILTEASGNVNLQTVRTIAQTGVDFISIGKLTHSATAVDIGLDEV